MKVFLFFSMSGDITTQNTNIGFLKNFKERRRHRRRYGVGKCHFGIFDASGKCGADA